MSFIILAVIVAVVSAAPEKFAQRTILSDTSLNKNSNFLCETQACAKTASTVLNVMDKTVSPCDNFYQYACGKFIKDTVIPEEATQVNVFSLSEEKLVEQMLQSISDDIKVNDLPIFKSIKLFYKSCIDTEKIVSNINNEIREVLENLGGWPILKGLSWNQSEFNWKKLVSQSSKIGYNINFFVRFEIDSFVEDNRVIQIYYPDMKDIPANTSNDTNDPAVQAYLKYITDAATILGADGEVVKKDLADLLEFELNVKNLFDSSEKISEVTLKQMESLYPQISWTELVNKILSPHAHVDENEEIIIWHPNSLKALFALIEKTPNRILANYGMWRIIRQSIEGPITGPLADAAAEYTSSDSSERMQAPRQETCFALVYEHFSKAAEALYIRHYFDKDTKPKVVVLVRNIRASLRDMIEQEDWMDNATKQKALVKLDSMSEYIGYPDELMDDEKLNESYKDLKVYPESFLKFLNSLNRFRMEERFATLGKVIYQTRPDDASMLYAGYNHKKNEIVIPVGALQQFFDTTRPNYVNYGTIGWFVGHEMTHAFDSTGSKFDQHGNYANWWNRDTKIKFLKKVACLVKQYNSYTLKDTNVTVDGLLTRGENIADNGGVKAAYFAYNEWTKKNDPEPKLSGLDYTPEQMFWISAASIWCQKIRPERLQYLKAIDEHPPAEARVIKTFSNIPEFARDFNCPIGSPMNPDQKCKVW